MGWSRLNWMELYGFVMARPAFWRRDRWTISTIYMKRVFFLSEVLESELLD